MSNPSDKDAGSLCARCPDPHSIEDPCLSWVDLEITDYEGKKSIKHLICGNEHKKFHLVNPVKKESIDNGAKLTLFAENTDFYIQENKSVDHLGKINIKLNSKCSISSPTCPEGLLIGPNEEREITFHKVNQSYEGELKYVGRNLSIDLSLIEPLKKLLKNGEVDANTFIGSTIDEHRLIVAKRHLPEYSEKFGIEESEGRRTLYTPEEGLHDAASIYIYPNFDFKINFGFSEYEHLSQHLTKNQQQEIQRANYREKNPDSQRSNRKAQKGYNKINPLLDKTAYNFFVKGEVNYANGTFGIDYEKSIKKLSESFERLTGAKHLEGIAQKILGASANKGGQKGLITPEWVKPGMKIEVEATHESSQDLTDSGLSWEVEIATYPLVGGKLTVDLVQALLLFTKPWGPVYKVLTELRARLDNPKNTNFKLRLNCDLSLKGEYAPSITLKKPYQADYALGFTANRLDITPKLKLEVIGGIKIWLASGVFAIIGKLMAKFSFDLRKNRETDRLEVAFFHKGATAEIKGTIVAKMGKGGMDNFEVIQILDEEKALYSFGGKWIIYDPLPEHKATILFS